MFQKSKKEKGTITPALLIITGAFLVVIYAMLFALTIQFDFSNRQVALEEALHVAEAGVNYYRWHLAHDPDDYQDGTGGPGPYEHEYTDPQGEAIGKFSLEITPPSAGSSVVEIESTGWTYQFPNVKRTVTVQYGQSSFADYSFLHNASSWFGSNITVNGKVHSNNGIRNDGTNLSLVTSAQDTYFCGDETGCTSQSDCEDPPESNYCTWNSSESECECNGVWGEGGDQGLWQHPTTPVNFESISFDYTDLQDEAEANGLYLDDSTYQGYHIVFNGDGTFTVSTITSTDWYYHVDYPYCRRLYERIANESPVGTYNISDIPIVFIEDHVWVEGEVDGKITIIAARFPIDSNDMNIWINDNITYEALDGNHALGLIAQNDIYFVRDVPEDFQIDAALLAQTGRIIRHAYWACPGNNSGNAVKDSLTINGSVISYLKSYWNYGSTPDSGFVTREVNYDPNLLYFPPPFFPTSGEYEFISWVEK